VASFSLLAFTSIFFIVDPIAILPVFLAVTEGQTAAQRRRTALRASLVAGGVLVSFALLGMLVFKAFGITIGAFRVAGGILLMKVALDMLHGQSSRTRSTDEDRLEAGGREDVAITPLGVPQLAGPGSIATVTLLANPSDLSWKVIPVLASIVLTCTASWLLMAGAERFQRWLGDTGTRILMKLMGLLLAAVAVEFVAQGVRELLPVLAPLKA
jgi:multiple antibiotic resistance protein